MRWRTRLTRSSSWRSLAASCSRAAAGAFAAAEPAATGPAQQAQGAEGREAKVQTAQIKAQADQFKAGASVQKTQLDMRRDIAARAQIEDLQARRDYAMAQAGVPTTNVM